MMRWLAVLWVVVLSTQACAPKNSPDGAPTSPEPLLPSYACVDADWEGLQTCEAPGCARARLGEGCSACILDMEACPVAAGCEPYDEGCAQRHCESQCEACLGEAACFQWLTNQRLVDIHPLAACSWEDFSVAEACIYEDCGDASLVPSCLACTTQFFEECPSPDMVVDRYGVPRPTYDEACTRSCVHCFGASTCADPFLFDAHLDGMRRMVKATETAPGEGQEQLGGEGGSLRALSSPEAYGEVENLFADDPGDLEGVFGGIEGGMISGFDTEPAQVDLDPPAVEVSGELVAGEGVDEQITRDELFHLLSEQPQDVAILSGPDGWDTGVGGIGLSGTGGGGGGVGLGVGSAWPDEEPYPEGAGGGGVVYGVIGTIGAVDEPVDAARYAPRDVGTLTSAYAFDLSALGSLVEGAQARCYTTEGTLAETKGRPVQRSDGTLVEVVGGTTHCCGRTDEGRVACWGDGANGRLGSGNANDLFSPAVVHGVVQVEQLVVAGATTCARSRSGGVFCWGMGSAGKLGDGTHLDRALPVAVRGLDDARYLAAGMEHLCAVRASGKVACWGYNDLDAVGDGSLLDRYVPVDVQDVEDGEQLALTQTESCVLRRGGGVACWGLGYTDAGAVMLEGVERLPPRDMGLTQVAGLAAGREHVCALRESGEVWCWGSNGSGQLGVESRGGSPTPAQVAAITDAIKIHAGGASTCVTHRDGQVSCWGAELAFE